MTPVTNIQRAYRCTAMHVSSDVVVAMVLQSSFLITPWHRIALLISKILLIFYKTKR